MRFVKSPRGFRRLLSRPRTPVSGRRGCMGGVSMGGVETGVCSGPCLGADLHRAAIGTGPARDQELPGPVRGSPLR